MISMSPTIGKIADALAKAQGEFKPIVKNASNPFFKSNYADLSSVLESVRPVLSKYGICVVQPGVMIEGRFFIETTFIHSSGEWLSSLFPVVAKDNTAQGHGSGVSYAKRYSLMGLAGVAASDDDDGAAASGRVVQTTQKQVVTAHKFVASEQNAVGDQNRHLARIFAVSREKGWDSARVHEYVKESFGVESLKALTPQQLKAVADYIQGEK